MIRVGLQVGPEVYPSRPRQRKQRSATSLTEYAPGAASSVTATAAAAAPPPAAFSAFLRFASTCFSFHVIFFGLPSATAAVAIRFRVTAGGSREAAGLGAGLAARVLPGELS